MKMQFFLQSENLTFNSSLSLVYTGHFLNAILSPTELTASVWDPQ